MMIVSQKPAGGLRDIYTPIKDDLDQVEILVRENLPAEASFICEINKHILSSRGKMIRSALVMLSAGISAEAPVRSKRCLHSIAAGIELIHTASLVHDDVIDKAVLRRNKTAINRIYGTKTAVLYGDSLYARAVSVISKNADPRVLSIITDATEKMCFGEIEQVNNKDNSNEKKYLEIIRNKTAVLMGACCQIGAMLGGLNEKQVNCLKEYGLNFGMAFQIADDFLDAQDEDEKGYLQIASAKYASEKVRYFEKAAKKQVAGVGSDQNEFKESLIALAGYVKQMIAD